MLFVCKILNKRRRYMISTFVHGIIDYVYAVLLIASPWLFHFNTIGAQTYVVDIVAATILTYSMFTKYQLSLSKSIPMKIHIVLDGLLSIFLVASPWLFHFADKIYLPHVLFGVAGLVVVLLSSSKEPENIVAKTA
jgi:hypothetical protein